MKERREKKGWMCPEMANIAAQSSQRIGDINGREDQSLCTLWSVMIAKTVRRRPNMRERALIAILVAIYFFERLTSVS